MLSNARHQASLVFFVHTLWLSRIHQPVHVVRTSTTISVFIIRKAAHARTSTCASSLPFVVPGKRVASSKTTAAFGTDVGSLASVQFCMALQVV
jgi:hypothetical protein